MAGKVNLQLTHFTATSVKKHNNCSYNIIMSLFGFVYCIIKKTDKFLPGIGDLRIEVLIVLTLNLVKFSVNNYTQSC